MTLEYPRIPRISCIAQIPAYCGEIDQLRHCTNQGELVSIALNSFDIKARVLLLNLSGKVLSNIKQNSETVMAPALDRFSHEGMVWRSQQRPVAGLDWRCVAERPV